MRSLKILIVSVVLPVFSFANTSLGLRYGVQSDRGEAEASDGTKLSLLLGTAYNRFNFDLQVSHISHPEDGNETVSLKLTTYEFLAWAKYNFWENPWISIYSGLGGGVKIDKSNLHLFNESSQQKSSNQTIGALCLGASIPFGENSRSTKEFSGNGEVQMISQPNRDYPELAFIVGLGLAFR